VRRTWATGLLVAALLPVGACSGGDDEGDAADEQEDTSPAQDSSTEPGVDEQLAAVQAAFDLSAAERTVMYDASQSIPLPDGLAFVGALVTVHGGHDDQVDRGSGGLEINLMDLAGGPVTSSTDVRLVDDIVWVTDRDDWLGWTLDATTASAAATGASWIVDAPGLLIEVRDSIEEVIEHSPMVAGTDQWVVLATPPLAFGFVTSGPTEMTIRTGAGGFISTILYSAEVPAEHLAGMIPDLVDRLGAVSTVIVEVEVTVNAGDRPLPEPVAVPCATPEPVTGPDGASVRCPVAG
jgi:hypothetical protein